MAKVTAPLLSFGAGGQIANSMVYSSWRGQPYSRRYVVPANPRTQAQTTVRDIFRNLNQFWALAPAFVHNAFDLYAQGRAFLGRNRFIGDNSPIMRGNPDQDSMAGLVVSPGARGGYAPVAMDAVANAGDIDVTFTLPTAPDGWTLTFAHALAFIDQPGTEAFMAEILSASDDTGTGIVTLPSAEAGDYVVAGFLQWEKPDGSIAYSRSLADLVTVA